MVRLREIIPKWAQDSGLWIMIIYLEWWWVDPRPTIPHESITYCFERLAVFDAWIQHWCDSTSGCKNSTMRFRLLSQAYFLDVLNVIQHVQQPCKYLVQCDIAHSHSRGMSIWGTRTVQRWRGFHVNPICKVGLYLWVKINTEDDDRWFWSLLVFAHHTLGILGCPIWVTTL